jgi:hypothetical protein
METVTDHVPAAQVAHNGNVEHPASPEADAEKEAELYEKVVARLRRDLVAELELGGNLYRDHP